MYPRKVNREAINPDGGSYRRALCVFLIASLLLGLALVWTSCDSPADGEGGCSDPISTDLQRIMYWGLVSPTQDEPNKGTPSWNIWEPNWYQQDKILIRSVRLDNNVVIKGIFEVTIDPVTHEFQAVEALAFPYEIRNYDYNPETMQFVVTFSQTANDYQIVRAQASGANLAIIDTLLDNSWTPLRSRFIGNQPGVIAYAQNPLLDTWGFHFVSESQTAEDSLIFAVELSLNEALAFDVQDSVLVFGREASDPKKTEVFVLDVGHGDAPRSVGLLEGDLVSIAVNLAGTLAIVSLVAGPGSSSYPNYLAYVIDLSSGRHERLDLKTNPCGFAAADFASWSPIEMSFAFSGGAFSGEGSLSPRQLWVKRGVPDP